MKHPKLLLIGGSAGSLQVIMSVLAATGNDYPLPVLIVVHRNPLFESSLEELLSHKTHRMIKEVEEKEAIQPGRVYLCPADYHVLVERDHSFSLDYSERVNYSRPSIDVTFSSAAASYGPGIIAVILSGGNADGVYGMQEIKARGGMTIVQDPLTAEVPYMPQQVLLHMQPDLVVSAEELPRQVRSLGYK
jgi:two-component system, chemotaxis family, protein-glutamate methylesterase/glutaminase